MEHCASTLHSSIFWTSLLVALAVSSVRGELERVKRAPPPNIPINHLERANAQNVKDFHAAPNGIREDLQGNPQDPLRSGDEVKVFKQPADNFRQPIVNKPVDNMGMAGQNADFQEAPRLGNDRKLVAGNKKKGHIKIASSVECRADANRFCAEEANNFQVLDCLQDDEKVC